MRKNFRVILVLILLSPVAYSQSSSFVRTRGHQFIADGKPYYFIGTNYWYASLLALQKDPERGIERLRKELDFLKSKGVSNLRVLAGAEGTGMVHGVQRVGPPLQKDAGVFDEHILAGLDVLLAELNRRNMKAVLFLSNNWEWSGGFLQYLRWNNLIEDSVFRRKLAWDDMRDYVSRFYGCAPCVSGYLEQVATVVKRKNKVTGKLYADDPAIMAWELANEPRPMRPAANEAYKQWINKTSAFIKSMDKNHLVTIGHEGEMGTESLELFEEIHSDTNVDYLTIHIWPKNWSWFKPDDMEGGFSQVITSTVNYINRHLPVARKLSKPIVIEEFGLPRDHHSFDPATSTVLRDRYYEKVFSIWKGNAETGGPVAGAAFWAFGGLSTPRKGQVWWKEGDDYTGDPPMEEQGLNSVFSTDRTTWQMIDSFTKTTKPRIGKELPSDKKATAETVNLYNNLKRLLNKGVMFGHQDALAYGVDWKYVAGRSDVKETAGDYPAVYGWELGNLEHNLPHNLDSVPFDRMRGFIKEAFSRGGINTISWHNDNPLNGASAWDTTHGAVAAVLPGGARHNLYNSWLDNVAAFMQSLKGKNGEAIPVLFRPYHELTGNWFWWCRNTCSPTEFKLLWRYTVNYLRDAKGVHNLLYVYNTSGNFIGKHDFLEYYPGDDVVDAVSFDAYQSGDPSKDRRFVNEVSARLTIIEEVAAERGKVPAFAETGYEKIPYASWWTSTLWEAIKDHKISYVLTWRNHGRQQNGNMHYYVPTKNDVSAEDFRKFYKLDRTLFEREVAKEKMYK